jgi:hypothetical protein
MATSCRTILRSPDTVLERHRSQPIGSSIPASPKTSMSRSASSAGTYAAAQKESTSIAPVRPSVTVSINKSASFSSSKATSHSTTDVASTSDASEFIEPACGDNSSDASPQGQSMPSQACPTPDSVTDDLDALSDIVRLSMCNQAGNLVLKAVNSSSVGLIRAQHPSFLAFDWASLEIFQEHFDLESEMQTDSHVSTRKQNVDEVTKCTLDECLNLFSEPEVLAEANKWSAHVVTFSAGFFFFVNLTTCVLRR